jgi:hypothetical protein
LHERDLVFFAEILPQDDLGFELTLEHSLETSVNPNSIV